MRFTLETVGDVDVPAESTLGACRAGLVALTGVEALHHASLSIDGHRLDEGQLAGAEPWVPGSVLRVGTPQGAWAPDPARQAVHAPWHLAVVAGPDEGLVVVPGEHGSVRLGRCSTGGLGAPVPSPGYLPLTDPAVSALHAEVRHDGRQWLVLDLGSANGTRLGARRRSSRASRLLAARPVGRRRARHLALGQPVLLGSTEVVVRRVVRGVDGAPGDDQASQRPQRPSLVSWVTPLVVSLTLALLLRSVVPLMFGLTALVPVLGGLRRPAPPRAPADRWPDPAASAVRACASAGELVHDAEGVPSHQGGPPVGGAGTAWWWSTVEEGVAVTGARSTALAVARALVGAAIAEPDVTLTFAFGADSADDWSWCRWVEHRPDALTSRSLLVIDGADRSAVDRRWLARAPGAGVVLVASDGSTVPAWCGWIVDEDGRRRRRGAGQGDRDRAPSASLSWAEGQSRRAAARDHRTRRGAALLPDRIGLVELGAPDDPEAIAAGWARQHGPIPALRAHIAVDATGPTSLDLLGDGPHLLVAGTTGAGKSALLQSLVLDLALRFPPDRLVVVLVDFKGGAGLGPCRRLPHVVGEVTDLDASLAARAIDGLRRELRRREILFGAAGVGDLESLRARGPAPPRILVVVDELRALRDDLPDVLPALIRLAAQGRSLGIHLVLATQRPAGAVDAQIRANVALRVCLRVTDPAESLDVVDVPDAAGLPADRPGRAVVRRGHAAPVVEQTAWACLAPVARPVRWAPRWPTTRDLLDPGDVEPTGRDTRREVQDTVSLLVDAARRAASGRTAGGTAPSRLWSPPLPTTVTDADLPVSMQTAGALAIGLADRPAERSLRTASWDPSGGALLVVGRPGSGRTTALRAVARSGLRSGLTVHRIMGRPPGRVGPGESWAGPWPAGGDWGTVVDVSDPRRLIRLLRLAREEAGHGAVRHLIVIDDVGGVLRLLEATPSGPGADLACDLIRDAARLGIGFAVAGNPADVLRLAPQASTRLVLATDDGHDDAALGVPRGLPCRSEPGRGVLVPGGISIQVSSGAGGDEDSGAGPRPPGPLHPESSRTVQLRLEAIPLDVTLTADELRRRRGLDPTAPTSVADHAPDVVLGRGGDDAALRTVRLTHGLLVIGPPGSGRSTALGTIRVALSSPHESRAHDLDGTPGPGSPDVIDLADLLAPRTRTSSGGTGVTGAALAARLLAWSEATSGRRVGRVVLCDDLDRLLRAAPEVDDVLTEWIERVEDGECAPVVVAAVRTDRAAAAYRGAVAALRRVAPVLVLAPLTPGSADAAGTSVTAAADGALPRHPGRGVLLLRGGQVPIQVGRPVRPGRQAPHRRGGGQAGGA